MSFDFLNVVFNCFAAHYLTKNNFAAIFVCCILLRVQLERNFKKTGFKACHNILKALGENESRSLKSVTLSYFLCHSFHSLTIPLVVQPWECLNKSSPCLPDFLIFKIDDRINIYYVQLALRFFILTRCLNTNLNIMFQHTSFFKALINN